MKIHYYFNKTNYNLVKLKLKKDFIYYQREYSIYELKNLKNKVFLCEYYACL
jgi:hypothetical protein